MLVSTGPNRQKRSTRLHGEVEADPALLHRLQKIQREGQIAKET